MSNFFTEEGKRERQDWIDGMRQLLFDGLESDCAVDGMENDEEQDLFADRWNKLLAHMPNFKGPGGNWRIN